MRQESCWKPPGSGWGCWRSWSYFSVTGCVGSADGTSVLLKTPRVWLGLLEILIILFCKRLCGIGRWDKSLAENPQGLAGDVGDFELTFLLEVGWGRQIEQESVWRPPGSGWRCWRSWTYFSVRGWVGSADRTGVWLKTPRVWLACWRPWTYFSVRGWVGSADGTAVWLNTLKDPAGDARDLELTFLLEAGWGWQKEQESDWRPPGSGWRCWRSWTYFSVSGWVESAEGTGVWLKTPRVWQVMLEILNLLFS